jgi:hypothetical protein
MCSIVVTQTLYNRGSALLCSATDNLVRTIEAPKILSRIANIVQYSFVTCAHLYNTTMRGTFVLSLHETSENISAPFPQLCANPDLDRTPTDASALDEHRSRPIRTMRNWPYIVPFQASLDNGE